MQYKGLTSSRHPAACTVWFSRPPQCNDLASWPFIAKWNPIRWYYTWVCWNQGLHPSHSNESVLMTHTHERHIVCPLLLRQGQIKLSHVTCRNATAPSLCFLYHGVSIWIVHNQIIQKWLYHLNLSDLVSLT